MNILSIMCLCSIAGVWAKDVDVINTLSRGLKAGTVWVNNTYNSFDCGMPFGGALLSLNILRL